MQATLRHIVGKITQKISFFQPFPSESSSNQKFLFEFSCQKWTKFQHLICCAVLIIFGAKIQKVEKNHQERKGFGMKIQVRHFLFIFKYCT